MLKTEKVDVDTEELKAMGPSQVTDSKAFSSTEGIFSIYIFFNLGLVHIKK